LNQEKAMKTTIKTTHSFASIVASAIVVLAWAGTASTANAADIAQPVRIKTVEYGDLNLDSEKGAQILFARLRIAAQDVCAPLAGLNDLSVKFYWQRCYDNALASAVTKVNVARVTALYAQAPHSPKG
jgi:UrcA family protein